MFKAFYKYKLVYGHLWRTYGRSRLLRTSYGLHVCTRMLKLIFQPIAISMLITALSKKDFTHARLAVLLFVGSSATMGILSPLTKYIGMLGENKWYDINTGTYFKKLVAADLDYFHSNLAGYLTTATRQYNDSCIQFVRALRDKYLTTALSILFPLAVIAWYDLRLGAVTLALSIVLAVYLLWASHTLNPYRAQSREAYKRNSGIMADIVANILAVKAAAQEADRVNEVREGAVAESKLFTRRYTVQVKLVSLRELITVIFFAMLLWLTVARMSSGNITLTVAVLVVTYTTTILTGIYALSDDLDEHDDIIDKIIPAFEVLNRKNSITDPAQPKKFTHVKGDITFNKVGFTYEKDSGTRAVFSDFSLHIPAGQKVGIVGLSGAGKSTLAKLLLRFNDVNEGAVLVDGTDARDVRQADLRRQVAYVPQEPLLFHASIKENVLVGCPNATEKQVHDALKTAHALSFVSQLPLGVDSIVGERGVKLSGGQKQRIAIARAVLQHTPIMVLDEATSALDSESEQIIKDSFAEVLKGRTAIVIAHRLSTLSEMDRIVVIEKGKLLEDGTHEELVAKNGAYARLWRRQLKHIEEAESVSVAPSSTL